MKIYASPRRGYCASCEMELTGKPVYYMDETYCCTGCVQGGPCVCTYEADRAEDGVDRLGTPFAVEAAPEEPVERPVGDFSELPVRGR
jgi:hypothetical protein